MKLLNSKNAGKGTLTLAVALGIVAVIPTQALAYSAIYVDGPYSSQTQCRFYQRAMLKDDSTLHLTKDCYATTWNGKRVWFWQYWS